MKPSIPKGTRDFSPQEMVKRNFIFDTIRAVYQKFGYLQVETPAIEKTETLMGKYGEEGDKLIFKILDSGDFLQKANEEDLSNKNSLSVANQISEKALRYDLTVPFARYVVQHQHEISFPFKRYQIQTVWRAEKPHKGRYREFYQCDADVIGSNSLLNEVELLQIIDEVFAELNLPVVIKLNNRKILSGIAEVVGEKERIVDITVAIDKLDKIGEEKVVEELRSKGIGETAIEKIKPLLGFSGDNDAKFTLLKEFLYDSEVGQKGIEELGYIMSIINDLGLKNAELELDITLARGLNYYTGAIIEVKANAGDFTSSICGGGRYDDLTGIFGLPNVSGVGISFGADRIYVVMDELDLFPDFSGATTQVLFVNFGSEEEAYCLPLVAKLREAGINTEIYPESAKMRKQMTYANNKNIPYVVLVGANEMQSGKLTVKDMQQGTQEEINIEALIEKLA